MSNLSIITKKISKANKVQASSALLIQAYSTSVLHQQKVDFSHNDKLKKYEEKINKGLNDARGHANNYLGVIQPQILHSIMSISGYYNILKSLPTTLPEGTTVEEWIKCLKAVKGDFIEYEKHTESVVDAMTKLNASLSEDSRTFSGNVIALNAAVSGDEGVLKDKENQVKSVEADIEAIMSKLATASVAEHDGFMIMAVGAVFTVATGGFAIPVVLGGAIVAGGSAIALSSYTAKINILEKQKANLIKEEKNLTAEVKLASGISTGYQGLVKKVDSGLESINNIKNVWEILLSDIHDVVSDLEKGISTPDDIRTIYLEGAKKEIDELMTDIEIIKKQMAGVGRSIAIAKPGETVGEAAKAAAKNAIGAAARH